MRIFTRGPAAGLYSTVIARREKRDGVTPSRPTPRVKTRLY